MDLIGYFGKPGLYKLDDTPYDGELRDGSYEVKYVHSTGKAPYIHYTIHSLDKKTKTATS